MKKFLITTLSITSLFAGSSSVVANGLNTIVNLQNSNYLVNGGIKKGDNLFFSFEKLNINSNESLTFLDSGIKNSISRITNETSFIDGTLNSSAKNLFLLNPNGIIFGKNAKLNLEGSLHISTADYLKFADDNLFYVNPLKSSVLTSASPTSFGFLGKNFATISISGQGDIVGDDTFLQEEAKKGVILNSGENLNIVAGEIVLENGTFYNKQIIQNGQIQFLEQNILVDKNGVEIPPDKYDEFASEATLIKKPILDSNGNKIPLLQRTSLSNLKVSEGNINLIAVDSIGEVNLNTLENNFEKYGDIKIDDFAINLSESLAGNENANIYLNAIANNFTMDKGNILLATLKAKSSKINIKANSINVLNGSNLIGATGGEAKGSNINLIANENIIFSGENEKLQMPIIIPKNNSFITTLTQGSGTAGSINLKAKNITFMDGAKIDSSSFNKGNSGDITLNATNDIIFNGENSIGDMSAIQSSVFTNGNSGGDGGNIYLNAKNILFSEGARILASMRGDGVGGNVELYATNSITLDGFENKAIDTFNSFEYTYELNNQKSHQYSSISTFNSDNSQGGNLILNAPNISILNGAFINTANRSKNTPNNLEIYTTNLVLNKLGEITSETTNEGNGGNIKIETKNLNLKNGSIINAESRLSPNGGDAGKIDIKTNQNFILKSNSAILTTAEDAGGGNIKMDIGKLFYLNDSKISTSVHGGDGNGGNVDITKPTFSVLNSSKLFANAYEGNGGNINISARDFIESTDSKISASSKFGRDGEINIKAVEVDVSDTLSNLPTNFLDVSKWKKTPCEKRKGSSSFIIEQREGLPFMIDDYQPTPLKVE